jgi:hypothetical protein
MRIYAGLATLLLGFAISSANAAPHKNTSTTVIFPENGPVSILGTVRQGDYPRLVFRSQRTGQLLLDAQVGKSDWKEFIDRDHPDDLDISVRFVVLHRSGLLDPLIMALVRQQGASDCRYNSALFGEVHGRLSEMSPDLPDHWMRGQILLSGAASGNPVTLTVTSERYQANDVHDMGPSRMAVFVYTYEEPEGKFVETRRTEEKSEDLHLAGEDLIGLFGAFGQC